MKQKFVVEIDSSDYVSLVSENDLSAMLRAGFIEWRMSNLVIDSVREMPSQTVENERPSVVLKGLDWSNRNEQEQTCYEYGRALDYMEIAKTNKPDWFKA